VTQKTNAARLLDQLGIHYELREYEVDPEDLAAETVAGNIDLPPGQLFKTLVQHARNLRSLPRKQQHRTYTSLDLLNAMRRVPRIAAAGGA
jgi:hypothetical protein